MLFGIVQKDIDCEQAVDSQGPLKEIHPDLFLLLDGQQVQVDSDEDFPNEIGLAFIKSDVIALPE